ncbi:NAD(+) diphosphatase [Arthrobacter sp. E3]|uniref:NAD(+) diphosphatase n=1 Tax=Arthrobacter sp. E3 TaxID=517402 RepID=UPI001FFD5466|nr:NAD(+) diphosphatase [Arthrobacter sp. E3]
MLTTNASPVTALDRQCEQRTTPGYLAAVLETDDYRVVVFHRGRALMDGTNLAYLDPESIDPAYRDLAGDALPLGGTHVYLGKVRPGQTHRLAAATDIVLLSLPLNALPEDATELSWAPLGNVFAGYRDVAQDLNAVDAQVFVEAQAVAQWHGSHVHCPRCGSSTESQSAGWMRRCTADGSQHFPRTDPAAIVAIVGADDRILLANNYAWNENRYSTVAGFVEAGESAEQAAVREIAEEVGVHLHSLAYVSSQAWPFPRSLMFGFIGYTNDTEATPDRSEVRAARWFEREELQAAVLCGDAVISHKASIARSLIENWYGGPILEPGEQA